MLRYPVGGDGDGSRLMKALGTVVLLAAVLAGCGGGPDGPTAQQKRAALDKWTRTADAACEKANTSIAKRGWPVNLVDLDRLTVRAITDIQAASKTIRAQKAPAGSEDKVKPFVQSLEELDATMKRLSGATERFKIKRLDKFLPKLGGSLQKVETASKKLGLRDCAAHQEHVFIPDAVRAPVFAQQLAELDRKLLKRTKRLKANTPVSTPQQAEKALRELSDIADTYARRLDDLKPPYWARKESDNYVVALRTLGRVFDRGAKALATPPVTPAEGARYDRELARAAKAERKAIKKLHKGIGAIPTAPGGGEDEAPAGDDSESA